MVGPGKNLDKTMAKVEEFQMGVFLSKERNRDFIAPHIGQELALKVLRAVEEEGAFANIALNRVLEKYRPGKLDRAFATELAYGTLRSLNTLDWILGHFVKKPLQSQSTVVQKHPQAGCVSAAVYGKGAPFSRLQRRGGIGKNGHGLCKFVNGVLRNVSRRHGEINYPSLSGNPWSIFLCVIPILSGWWSAGWRNLVLKKPLLCAVPITMPAPNTIRTNTLKITRSEAG